VAQPAKAISTVAEFDARLAGLQRAADAASPAPPGRIPMGQIFELARHFVGALPEEIEVLLDQPDHPPRVAAVSIMDFQARSKTALDSRRRELYELYLRRHDRISTWDLVDRAAPHVIGGYLWDKSREPLYRLAASPHWYERRTSIGSTWFLSNTCRRTYVIITSASRSRPTASRLLAEPTPRRPPRSRARYAGTAPYARNGGC
jgi:hypothetical protein